jgi:hypothetical protein
MTNEETIGKLIEMRLTAMANAFREQMNTPDMDSLSFEERIGLLTDIEWTVCGQRKWDNRALEKSGHFKGHAPCPWRSYYNPFSPVMSCS